MDERRARQRRSYRCEVEFIGADANSSLRGVISDLSTSGCYVETQTPLEAGTPLQLIFNLNDGPLPLLGTVRYAHPNMGMGIEFLKLSPDELEKVQHLLKTGE